MFAINWKCIMNVQKIFDALNEDTHNSALGIICSELENQGYSVVIDSIPITSAGFFDGKHGEIENKIRSFEVTLKKSGAVEQEFCIEFADFHEFILREKRI